MQARARMLVRSSLPHAAALAVATLMLIPLGAAPSAGPLPSSQVIVMFEPGVDAAAAVRSVGGEVLDRFATISGLVARVPSSRLDSLGRSRGITVSPDASLRPQGTHVVDGVDQKAAPGSLLKSVKAMRVRGMWKRGFAGAGVDVALIDTGVSPVEGLTGPTKVTHGPDLSFESQDADLLHLDTFGHGTNMAGIIAGKDSGAITEDINADGDFLDDEERDKNKDGDYDDEGDIPPIDLNADGDTLDADKGYPSLQKEHFVGVAPEAGLLSVKVGDSNGSTDVSQVLAAIDWIIQHKNDAELGLNVRVLNLSYGTDGLQSYLLDPLTYAVETAWENGIVVVVAAGNEGFGSARLNNPAYDPFIIAVGADDTKGTNSYADDRIPDFSARGNYFRHPDFVAPGKGILSLAVPGSRLAEMNPLANLGTTGRFLRGSGTSQAAAMVSGAAALLIQERPELTPDQVKQLLIETAHPLRYADEVAQGAGLLKVSAASSTRATRKVQEFRPATGMGSLQASRGSDYVSDEDGTPLVGEQDILGQLWDPAAWSSESASLTSWVDGDWMGRTWSGSGWLGRTWSSADWSGNSWAGRTWSGRTWSGRTWSGSEWGGDEGWTENGGISKSVFFGRTWSSVYWR